VFLSLSPFAHTMLAVDPATGVLSAGGALVLLVGLWLPFGPGARRRRAFQRALLSFQQGAWPEALKLVKELQDGRRLPLMWEGRLRNLEGECHRFAGQAALKERRFEDGLEHLLTSARLLGINLSEERLRVIDAMLDCARKSFAAGAAADTEAASAIADRVLALEPNQAEALFWQGLCLTRQERFDQALTALRASQQAETSGFLDPALYLGALSLRQGAAPDAVRHLSEANRLAPKCPLATWQLGMAILAADGDSQVATRALQRARDTLAALQKSEKTAQQFWLGAFPEGKSYVRRLALKYAFTCPLLGNSATALFREVQLGLGQALYRQGDFQESVQQYLAALHAGPPTVPVLRGLGQALARAERYEEAYNHLRAAFDGEEPKSPFTAGYLALCGAKGKPSGPEDKIKNVQWALGLLAQFEVHRNKEWATLCNAIHAEARGLNLPIAANDQTRLCEALASVDAADIEAARAYEHLAATFPEAVRPAYAWLYCRAAEQHACGKEHDLDLFARAFADASAARAFYAERSWNFDDMEYTYLERSATKCPGRFPEALGQDYAARGAELLLARSSRQEEAGDAAGALTSAEVLRALAPQNVRALDRLAQLQFRRSDPERAAELLGEWSRLEPGNALPCARQAVIEQQRGNCAGSARLLEFAMERAREADKPSVAFLGARLALGDLLNRMQPSADGERPPDSWQQAVYWLTECLKRDPNHEDALWCLAAVHGLRGDCNALAGLAALLNRSDVTDARFQFMAACCHLAAGSAASTLEACSLADKLDASLANETAYVAALAHAQAGDRAAAATILDKVVMAPHTSAIDHAHGLAAQFSFSDGNYEDAIEHWQRVDAGKRTAWNLDEPLRQTVFLSALRALQAGDFAHAATRLREAGRLGLRERRLGDLLILALVSDGQRLLREAVADAAGGRQPNAKEKLDNAARLLEQAQNAGGRQPEIAYLLALAYKRQDKPREARAAFRKIAPPDANVLLQLGLLSLRDGQPAQAEQELSSAWQADPRSYVIGFDLFMTRLTLGRIDASLEMFSQFVECAVDDAQRGLLQMLRALLHWTQAGDAQAATLLCAMSDSDERRLIDVLRSIGHLETASLLLESLGRIRPQSAGARHAYVEAGLVRAKQMLERCDWAAAARQLTPLREMQTTAEKRCALLNLLGCCECLGQEFKQGAEQFRAAQRIAKDDVCVLQNLALIGEWTAQHADAEKYWDAYFENLLAVGRTAAGQAGDHHKRLAFEGFSRLATLYGDKERWTSALKFAQRAYKLRPSDSDTLEKLFHLFTQAGRTEDARRMLRELRESRPGDPQFELYELDLKKVRNLDSIEEMIANIERILKRNPNDARVEVRANLMVANVLPIFERLFSQQSDQLTKVFNQIRYLPKYQIDWSAVREIARDLRQDFNRLRRLSGRCVALIKDEEQRDTLRELSARIERKLEQCRSLVGG
jgi:Flp pilus assembly protein TadD